MKIEDLINEIKKQGISLIVLVISIIVMLILAGAIIVSTSNTNVLSSAQKAKLDAEIANEKQVLNFCIVNAKVLGEKRNLTVENLNKELAQYNAQATMEVDTIVVQFIKSQRYYTIDSNGKAENVKSSDKKILTIECKTSSGTVIDTKEYKVITDKYSIELPVIEGYEAIEPTIAGTIDESKTVSALYYVILDDDTELVFTGLDSAGKVTTVENDIVSYMIGDGTTTYGNALKYKKNRGILKVPEMYKNKSITKIGTRAFTDCKTIYNVYTGENVTNIDEFAFSGCSNIVRAIFGKKLKTLGLNAFLNCTNLRTLIIETEVSGVIFNRFASCSNLREIKVSEANPKYKVVDNILYSKGGTILYMVPPGRSGKLVIPSGVVTVWDYAAYYNSKMTSVEFTDDVNTVKQYAFNYCSKIENVTLGKNIKALGSHAFSHCTKLTTLEITTELNGITLNNSDQFHNCPNFTEIKVNEGNKTYKVEDNILYSKDGTIMYLVPNGRRGELIVPESVTTMFLGCLRVNPYITKIVTSNSLKTIGQSIAAFCTSLKEVTIGEKVTSIGQVAFGNSTKLKTVTIDSKTIAKALTSQTTAGSLVNYATTIYIKEGITEIGSYVLDNFDEGDTDKEGYVKYVKKTT